MKVRPLHQEKEEENLYEVVVDNRNLLLSSVDLAWANAMARAIDAYMPPHFSHQDALRVALRAFLNMPGMRFFVSGLLRSEAEQLRIKSLEAAEKTVRDRYETTSQALALIAEEMEVE